MNVKTDPAMEAEVRMKLSACPHCKCPRVEMERDSLIFNRQDYGDRYPPEVSHQSHGFRARCPQCGCQTCWWHYEREVIAAWNGQMSLASIIDS